MMRELSDMPECLHSFRHKAPYVIVVSDNTGISQIYTEMAEEPTSFLHCAHTKFVV